MFKACFLKSVFLVEDFLKGDYRKFNSNQFMINTNTNEVLNDFSLWTYYKTQHQLMVVDLQGVKQVKDGKTYFYLTDPAINSVERIFGPTDMGEQGIMGCIYTFSLSRNNPKGKFIIYYLFRRTKDRNRY